VHKFTGENSWKTATFGQKIWKKSGKIYLCEIYCGYVT